MTSETVGAPGTSGSWLQDERNEAAAGKILDAAAELFVERGVSATGMAEVAKAAGCSRATLYRYFENRRALHRAYVHREARRLGEQIAARVAPIDDARARVTEAVLLAIDEVRSTPTLAAWFGLGDAGLASELASTSEVIEVIGTAFLADVWHSDHAETVRRARWLVRAIVSLLTVPGADAADERTMVEQFLVPVLIAPGTADRPTP
ncbi:helix-turn-helix domain-containing protein [Rhodococcus sp. TAF43]|uniref:TetR/AcrR family transcriptional regulator n=1 Tax=unclassified Rhodococcus (in: high G+C Gram-positive bacteria) TaxID=192944 RepID=UPI000E0A6A1D|nr:MULTISPECIES: helix-turn-helix domain-containing protein [unclassified Rhodococcus (in: high G+C Gram-positive bacteria)]QKT12278.1 TetR/AcrR family transcriptional regulator [Rhodococcus sp. W8901]RDI32277.1 TetR family transcriptional regulator [Rhodococcus sp. AG1013]